jgi:hypothetical protein
MRGDSDERKCVNCSLDATAASNGARLRDFIENIDLVDRFFKDVDCIELLYTPAHRY